MQLEIIILSEISQEEKDKYHMMSLTCGIQTMAQVNLSTKQKQNHGIENRFVIAKGEGRSGTERLGVWGQ